MIAVGTEHLLTLSQLARPLPCRRNERPVHPATIHRWRHPGVRGVRLECVRIGGIWHTSMEAFQRFCNRLSVPDGTNEPAPQSHVTLAPAALHARHQDDIERRLDEIGA
jgi:hypothetical protein